MIEILPESVGDTVVVRASGVLTDADYKNTLIPALDAVLAQHRKLNALVLLDDPLGFEPAAMWDDARYGLKHRADIGRMAVVGGPGWIDWATRLWGLMSPGEFRAFPADQAGAARCWIASGEAAG